MNTGYQQVIRPVTQLTKLGTTLTIPAFSVLTNEPVGKCLRFVDTDTVTGDLPDYELFGDPLNQLYFDLWVKPISLNPASQTLHVLFKRTVGSGGGVRSTFILSIDQNYNVELYIQKTSGTSTTLIARHKVQYGSWNHIGVVWDGTQSVGAGHNGYIWVNGQKSTFALVANTVGPFYNTTPVVYNIGVYPAATYTVGDALIDELRIWGAAQPDSYFEQFANAPRATGTSDADANLIEYFRFNEAAGPWTNAKPGGAADTLVAGAGAAAPAIVSTEEYPSHIYYSFPCVELPLLSIGINFTFIYPQTRPAAANWSLAVRFLNDAGVIERYFLWRTADLRGAEDYPDYAGETIPYASAALEVWYNYADRTCALAAPITIPLGIKLTRSSLVAESDPNLVTLTADTDIATPYPLVYPITP